jgi:hypothetical protein
MCGAATVFSRPERMRRRDTPLKKNRDCALCGLSPVGCAM